MLIGFKYHVPSRGLMYNNTWRIYGNSEKTLADLGSGENPETIATYVDHIEIEEGVRTWTGENQYGIGFAMFAEGKVEYREFEDQDTYEQNSKGEFIVDSDNQAVKVKRKYAVIVPDYDNY